MSALRFHHVFFTLMLAALISAFLLKPEQSHAITPQIQALFAPITRPAAALGQLIENRANPPVETDHRSIAAIAIENDALRNSNLALQAEVDRLRGIEAIQTAAGESHGAAQTCKVLAADAGTHEALSISGSTRNGIAIGQAATYSNGIAGKIVQAGPLGARVQLITDKGAGLSVCFGRFVTINGNAGIQLLTKDPIAISGAGENTLVVDLMSRAAVEAAGLRLGDSVLLSDGNWPTELQNHLIGQVTKIAPRADSIMFARITVSPPRRLMDLPSVDVMVK